MASGAKQDRGLVERVLLTIGLVVLVLAAIALFYFTFNVILLIFGAVLLAIFLRGLADALGRYIRIKEGWLVMIVAFGLIGVLAAAIAGLAPSIAEQTGNLRAELPRSIDAARTYILQFGWGRALLEQLPDAGELWNSISDSGVVARLGGIFSSTLGAIGNLLIMVLLAIYFAVEPEFYVKGFAKLFPIDRRERVLQVLTRISGTLRWWLIGKGASMLFIGVLTWIALSILGVPLALTLGLIAGLLSFIPNFGPIMSAIPAILIGFVQSPMTAVWVIAIFVGVQLIESNIVTPLIERETVELPPALTIIFQLSLAVMVGGAGLILATPLLAVIMVIVQMVYIGDVLGDHEDIADDKQLESELKTALKTGEDIRDTH